MFAKITLWILGLSFAFFGAWSLVSPVSIAELIHFDLTNNVAVTEMRAFYGGVELGFAAFLLAGALRPGLRSASLLSGAFILGAIAISRTIGLVLDGSGSFFIYTALATEVIGCLACWFALSRQPA